MKNFILALLIIGLLVSLWFNWKSAKMLPGNTSENAIQIGKDSFRLVFYLKKSYNDSSDNLLRNLSGPPPGLFSTVIPCGRIGCEEDHAIGTPPWGIMDPRGLKTELMRDMLVLQKYYPKLERVSK